MVPLTKSLLSLSGRSIRQIVTRRAHHKTGPDFHGEYGNAILVGGFAFCVAVWSYVATLTGLTWNVFPIGKVTPQNWREVLHAAVYGINLWEMGITVWAQFTKEAASGNG
ncbi:cytochrome c oxidase subunit 7B, mitochondrial-like [Carcharodon carcharias]|uniref:cytochrome c oxidase subunit 7B, mitochondrial-like n=1 Tax=Carcharodon carcharias TaxID=13397 RepID=UPI001B7E90B1|nr:cytochrome c oxidase subunit 7B, mitochondrial-like [Carcharodon carcharias]